MIWLDKGDLMNAQMHSEKALALSENRNERQNEGLALVLLGRILGNTGSSRVGLAEERIHQGLKIFDALKLRPYHAQGYLFLGELHQNQGHKEKAIENLKKAEGMFQQMGMDYWLGKTQNILERV
jgi:tetratricopeptide (TPR) repeat protein